MSIKSKSQIWPESLIPGTYWEWDKPNDHIIFKVVARVSDRHFRFQTLICTAKGRSRYFTVHKIADATDKHLALLLDSVLTNSTQISEEEAIEKLLKS